MKIDIESLTSSSKKRLEGAMNTERQRQLELAYRAGTLLNRLQANGGYRFDGGAIDLAYQTELDNVCRDLNTMVLREQISEDDKDDIIDSIM